MQDELGRGDIKGISRSACQLGPEHPLPLTPGKAYVVYAIAFRSGQVWLYVTDDDELYYPLSYPAALFNVVDARVSRHWHFRQTPGHLDHTAILAIPEWAGDRFFYDRLTDREDRECEVFTVAKQAMDAEAYS